MTSSVCERCVSAGEAASSGPPPPADGSRSRTRAAAVDLDASYMGYVRLNFLHLNSHHVCVILLFLFLIWVIVFIVE